ncbi:MAG: hypothetical protein IJW41_02200 [Oscillospiraceae bacterium]|nr:hypothetical protein [Oscillospiraceae bacterium]
MGFFSVAAGANYKRYFKKLRAVAKKEHRFYPFLLWDTGWCVLRYGMALTDYLNFKLYNRSHAERKEYFGAMREEGFYDQVSPPQYKKRFTIKPAFIREFSKYTKREITVPGQDSFEDFCGFLDRHAEFMSKPYDGSGGASVKKEKAADITDRKAYYDYAVENRIFLEELVKQHPEMNVLCPASVNTIRAMTYNDHGTPILLWIGLRVGNGVNPVDNFHAQGMGVKIDMETGKLIGNGIDKDNQEFTKHPTTGVTFDGFQLPCYEEAKQMVLEACLLDDNIRMIGWDIALSDKGPLIIEANRWPGFDLVQVLEDRGRMDIVRDVLKRHYR